MSVKKEQPQPKNLSTGERLATTGRAVVQGIVHKLKGEHETEDGGRFNGEPAAVLRLMLAFELVHDPLNNGAARRGETLAGAEVLRLRLLFLYTHLFGVRKLRWELRDDAIAQHIGHTEDVLHHA